MRPASLAIALAGLVSAAPAAHALGTPSIRSPGVFVAVLEGGYNQPPVETPANGTVELTWTGKQLRYDVHVDSISDVTGAFIHIGRQGQETPAVADLFDGVKAGPVSGLLAQGTLGKAELHGTSMARLVEALRSNDAYVTVNSLAVPGGEIRGQLRKQPAVARR